MGGARWDKGRAPSRLLPPHTTAGATLPALLSGEIQSTSLQTHLEPFLPAAIRFREEEFNPSPGRAASASRVLPELSQPKQSHGRALHLCSVLWGRLQGGEHKKSGAKHAAKSPCQRLDLVEAPERKLKKSQERQELGVFVCL